MARTSLVALISTTAVFFCHPCGAEDITAVTQSMAEEVLRYDTTNPPECPRGPSRPYVDSSVVCRSYADDMNAANDAGDSKEGERLYQLFMKCWEDVNAYNAQRNEYNKRLTGCHTADRQADAPPSPKSKPQNGEGKNDGAPANTAKEQLKKQAADLKKQMEEDDLAAKLKAQGDREEQELKAAAQQRELDQARASAKSRTQACLDSVSAWQTFTDGLSGRPDAVPLCKQYVAMLKSTACNMRDENLHLVGQRCALEATVDRKQSEEFRKRVQRRMLEEKRRVEEYHRQQQQREWQAEANQRVNDAFEAFRRAIANQSSQPSQPTFSCIPGYCGGQSSGGTSNYPRDWAPAHH